MLKVAYISDYPFSIGYGGKEIQLTSYKKFLTNDSSIEVKLMDWWDKNFLNDVSIVHFFGHSNFRNLFKQLKQKNKKIVISPTIYHEKDWKFRKIAYYLGNKLPIPNFYKNVAFEIQNADAVIVNSNAEKEYILRNISPVANVYIVHNAIEDNFNIIDNYKSQIFLEKYGLNKYNYILSVGMLDERKNSLLMIKAFLNVYNRIGKKLVIIGDFRFSKIENYKRVKELLEENKDKILHIGYIGDTELLKSAYLNCSYHLLPSVVETPGIANLEAMAFGKNIVVGNCKPVSEYFGNYAIYCYPKKISSIENAILRANKLPYYNENNKVFVINNYTYSKTIKDLKNIYIDVAG